MKTHNHSPLIATLTLLVLLVEANSIHAQSNDSPQNKVYDGLPKQQAEEGPPVVRIERSPLLPPAGARRATTPPRHESGDDGELQELVEAVDRLMESSTIKRMLGLMSENVEQRAELRVQQAENKAQLLMMEIKLDRALEQTKRTEQLMKQSVEKLMDELRQAELGRAEAERRAAGLERQLLQLQQRAAQSPKKVTDRIQNNSSPKEDRESKKNAGNDSNQNRS